MQRSHHPVFAHDLCKLDNVIREVIVGGDTAGWTADFGNVVGLNHVYPQLEEFAAFWTLKEDKAVVIRWYPISKLKLSKTIS